MPKNPFSSTRPASVQIYLNGLANSRNDEIKKISEMGKILQDRIEELERRLREPDWVVEGKLEVGGDVTLYPPAAFRHSLGTVLDGEGKMWLQLHEGDAVPNTSGWGQEHRGYLFFHTVYRHTLVWNGSGWEYAPWDGFPGGAFVLSSVPLGAGWVECDGSTQTYLKGDGTTANIILPNTTIGNYSVWVGPSFLFPIPFGATGSGYSCITFRLFFRL